MNVNRHFILVALLAMTSAACTAGPRPHYRSKENVQTKVTAEEKKVTADDQMKGSEADLAVTRKLRSHLTDDKRLSVSAQNITIVTVGKKLTLSGKVQNKLEKDRVIAHARQLKGTRTISNQLTYTE